jgi:hypothetical protein
LEQKCEWTGDYGNMKSHIVNGCSYHTISCSQCLQLVIRRDMTHHQQNDCPSRVIECGDCKTQVQHWLLHLHSTLLCRALYVICSPYRVSSDGGGGVMSGSGCGQNHRREQLKNHQMNECVSREVSCEYRRYGCMQSIKLNDVTKHMKDDIDIHMRMLRTMIDSFIMERPLCPLLVAAAARTVVPVVAREGKELKVDATATAVIGYECPLVSIDPVHRAQYNHVLPSTPSQPLQVRMILIFA